MNTDTPFLAKFVTSVGTLSDRTFPKLTEIAIGGRSNVGKSSLLNALCGQKALARVSKTPGRTRLLNYFEVSDPSFYLVDLPGYGYAKAAKDEQVAWRKVVDKYLTKSTVLAGVIVLVDAMVGPTALDREFIEWLIDSERIFRIVLTKSDKPKQSELAATIKTLKAFLPRDTRILKTSAEKLTGMEALRHEIRLLVRGNG